MESIIDRGRIVGPLTSCRHLDEEVFATPLGVIARCADCLEHLDTIVDEDEPGSADSASWAVTILLASFTAGLVGGLFLLWLWVTA